MSAGSQRLLCLSLAGTLILALSLPALGCGGEKEEPEPVLSAGDFPDGRTGLLNATSASASSNLPKTGSHYYGPENLVDTALSTAWVVGAGVVPAGQTATITLEEPSLVERVEVANGYQKSPQTMGRNGSVKFLLLTFADGTSISIELEDREGWQLHDIPDVVGDEVRLKMVAIYPGSDRGLASAALTEIRLLGRTR